MDTILFILIVLLYIGLIGASLYLFILLIMIARRGIKALDIYINEKRSSGRID